MYIYLIAIILSSISMFFSEFYHKRIKNSDEHFVVYYDFYCKYKDKDYILYILFFILGIFPYFFLSGFRYGVGTDYFYTYYPGFYQIMAGVEFYPREPFFEMLNKIILLFTTESQWLFIITSFIFSLFMMLSIKKMTNNWFIGAMMIGLSNMYFISMNNVRQYLAIAVGIYAYSWITDRDYIRFIFFSVLSCFFHLTALVMVPLYILAFLSGFDKLKKYSFGVIIGLVVLSPSYIPLAKIILKNTRYIKYFYYTGNPTVLYFYMIPAGVTLLLSLLFYKKILKNNKYAFGLICSIAIATIISLLSIELPVNETMSRACNWFYWAICFLIPMFLDVRPKKWQGALLSALLIILAAGGTYYMICVLGHHEVLPYRFFWNTGLFI